MAIILMILLVIAIAEAGRRMNKSAREWVRTITDAQLDEEIEWAIGFCESESLFYDERRRRDAAAAA